MYQDVLAALMAVLVRAPKHEALAFGLVSMSATLRQEA
jgi:hypothetical protein